MIQKETIINRFTEKFGMPIPILKFGRNLPCAVGERNHTYGLTTDLTSCINAFILKYKSDQDHFPNHKMEIVDPIKVFPELKFYAMNGSEKVEMFWTTNRLIEGMRVLDNKPFETLQVSYFPDEVMPLAVSRKVGPDVVSVIIVPQMIPFLDPMQTEMENYTSRIKPKSHETKWLNQLPNTTFWRVQDVWIVDNQVVRTEEQVKCYVCKVEMSIPDWTNRALRDNHPQCRCQCNTYDDFCGCARQREMATYDRLWKQAKTASKFARRATS